MAAAVQDPRGGAGRKLKNSLKRKKKMKIVAKPVASELEEENKDPDGLGGSPGRCASDEEAVEANSEDEAGPRDSDSEDAADTLVDASTGWADAMAKILNKKTPTGKPTILVRNQELEKEKETLRQERLERRKQLDRKREWEMLCRVKPDVVQDKEAERNLQRIATRGVVQLFNAVQKHQKNVDEKAKEAGGSVRKRAKLMSTVSKKDFISVLRGMDGSARGPSAPGRGSGAEQAEVKEEGPGWTILRDDFMMGASMKDWDKKSDGPGGSSPGPGSDTDP